MTTCRHVCNTCLGNRDLPIAKHPIHFSWLDHPYPSSLCIKWFPLLHLGIFHSHQGRKFRFHSVKIKVWFCVITDYVSFVSSLISFYLSSPIVIRSFTYYDLRHHYLCLNFRNNSSLFVSSLIMIIYFITDYVLRHHWLCFTCVIADFVLNIITGDVYLCLHWFHSVIADYVSRLSSLIMFYFFIRWLTRLVHCQNQ
jgi:hypothetical protein